MVFEFGYKNQSNFVRNIYLPYKEVIEKAGNKTDQYSSIFGYQAEDISHCPIYAPMYFDFDSVGISKAYQDVKNLLSIFSFYGLTDQDYKIAFSGAKGFHLTIAPVVFSIKPMADLDKIFKKIALWFLKELGSKTIDLKVYERRRLWRIINTKNSKSGLFKIPVSNESLEKILEKAKTPQLLTPVFPKTNPVLSTWIDRAKKELDDEAKPKKIFFTTSGEMNPDIKFLIASGVSEGNRNHTAFYISCYLKSKGYSFNEAFNHLETYATNCNPPYTEKNALLKTCQSAYKR